MTRLTASSSRSASHVKAGLVVFAGLFDDRRRQPAQRHELAHQRLVIRASADHLADQYPRLPVLAAQLGVLAHSPGDPVRRRAIPPRFRRKDGRPNQRPGT